MVWWIRAPWRIRCIPIPPIHTATAPGPDRPSTRSQAIDVGGKQPAACRIPFRVGLPGLSEHRSEANDIARSHVLTNRAVDATTFDDPLHGAVGTPACRTSTTPSPSTPACRAARKATATACCGACDTG